ncbi:transglutaminase domain-containing protein [Lysinibacillus sp. NPDC094403]|uniref:transglutaminase domain-containing protein n=1 Tax=Lysinibacillus sp. NPDC094403 TaxID=3390581 RepID=UPI003CFF8716
MEKKSTLKVLVAGALLATGMFATVATSGTAHAEWQLTPGGSWIYKEYIPKASEFKTLAEVKQAMIALYNSPEFEPKDVVVYTNKDYNKELSEYSFFLKDISQDIPGYAVYGRSVSSYAEEISKGVYKNTIFISNRRDKEDEDAWYKKMDKAEKYIVDNYKLETDYDVVFAVNDFVGSQISYGKKIPKDHPYLDTYDYSVCMGYTNLAASLYVRFGIESRILPGVSTRTGEGHVWNAVKVGGKWYHSDATFYDGGDKKNPKYLLMTEAERAQSEIVTDTVYTNTVDGITTEIPLKIAFKATDTKFEMSMIKPYNYEKQHKTMKAKK